MRELLRRKKAIDRFNGCIYSLTKDPFTKSNPLETSNKKKRKTLRIEVAIGDQLKGGQVAGGFTITIILGDSPRVV